MNEVVTHIDKADALINRASRSTDAPEQTHLMLQAMAQMSIAIEWLATRKAGKVASADDAREMLREARTLSARSLRALKAADVALTNVLAWERTYYAPEEKAAMRDVEIARRKIRRLMKPGQFVEDESAAGDESERDQHLTDHPNWPLPNHLAPEIKLDGAVNADWLDSILDGKNPYTGEPIGGAE